MAFAKIYFCLILLQKNDKILDNTRGNINMAKIFLGRFLLMQSGSLVGEGYQLGRNCKIKSSNQVTVYDIDVGQRLGNVETIKIGDKLFVDVYAEENDTLHNLFKKGKKLLMARGRTINFDEDRKLNSYELSYITVSDKVGSIQQIDKITVKIDFQPDISVFRTNNFQVK